MATRAKPEPLTDPVDTMPIMDLVRETLPDPDWFLDTPNGVFGGRTPRECLADPAGELKVRQMMGAIRYGIFA